MKKVKLTLENLDNKHDMVVKEIDNIHLQMHKFFSRMPMSIVPRKVNPKMTQNIVKKEPTEKILEASAEAEELDKDKPKDEEPHPNDMTEISENDFNNLKKQPQSNNIFGEVEEMISNNNIFQDNNEDDPLNDPLNDTLNDTLNDPLNDTLNDPLNDTLNDPSRPMEQAQDIVPLPIINPLDPLESQDQLSNIEPPPLIPFKYDSENAQEGQNEDEKDTEEDDDDEVEDEVDDEVDDDEVDLLPDNKGNNIDEYKLEEYMKMSVKGLKAKCIEMNLQHSGNKSTLAKRIVVNLK